jgi:hypothetical protein
MNKFLLNSLNRERQELIKDKTFTPRPFKEGLRVVAQPSDDSDVKEFKARIRERKAQQKRAEERKERKFKSTLACKFAKAA